MKQHDEIQGSPEWLALRASYFTASEAPAMMGVSPYMTRTELLHQKFTGFSGEVDSAKQQLFDKGHAAEATARAIAEQIISDELYPITGSVEVDGLHLLASFDGLTMDGATAWEHKLWSQPNADHIEATGEPPIHHIWQLEHQLLVSSAEGVVFMTSDGTQDRMARCWYTSKPERRAALIAGWKQFEADLAVYAPSVAEVKPVGSAPDMLPALRIEVTGMVTSSNLSEFKSVALAAIRGVNRDLKTDQDFADGEKSIKWCADVESRIAAAKQHALSQTASIDELFRVLADVSEEARQARLALEKLVKARKVELRDEIHSDAMAALAVHAANVSKGLGGYGVGVPADARTRIADAMKGRKTIASLRDAADTVRAAIAIEMTEQANTRLVGLSVITQQEPGHEHLWSRDTLALIELPVEQLAEVLSGRIAKWEAEQSARLEADREKIRAEERAIAEREALAKANADREAMLRWSKKETELIAASNSTPLVFNKVTLAAPVDTGAVLHLGEINARIAPLSISADGLAELGFQPVRTEKAAKLYRACDYQAMVHAMVSRLSESVVVERAA